MKTDHPIDPAIAAGLALAWAVVAIVRLLLVPLLAAVLVLLLPRRRAVAPASPPPPAAAPAVPAFGLAGLAAELQLLPAAELRAMAGTRARASKAALVSRICALPI